MINYTKKAIKGAGFIIIAHILASILSYLTRIILARNLAPAEYGLFYSVFTFIIFFLFFRDLGLTQALVKYIPEFKIMEKYNAIKTAIVSILSLQFLSSIVFGALILIFSNFLAINYFKNSDASLFLEILIIYILFSILFRTIKLR